MPGSPLAQTSGKFQQQKLVAAVFPGLNQQVLAFLGISTFISLGLADDSLHHLRDYRKSVFLHRFIQCCMKGGLNALDSLGQNFAAEFCPQWPAAFLRSA